MSDYCVHCSETREVVEQRRAGCTVWICTVCGKVTAIEYDEDEEPAP